ncbi:MAG: DUF565 domain-containing protein [Cyanobacteria bacterium J06598_3]
MQRTRLNRLFDQTTLRFRQWVFNPWRRLAVVLISLLFGNIFATGISATAGQTAQLDVVVAAILMVVVEFISWLYYRFTPRRRQSDRLNAISPEASSVAVTPTNADISTGLEAGPVRSRSTLAEALNAFKLGMTYGLFVEAFKLGS